jgi:hypothetical protein
MFPTYISKQYLHLLAEITIHTSDRLRYPFVQFFFDYKPKVKCGTLFHLSDPEIDTSRWIDRGARKNSIGPRSRQSSANLVSRSLLDNIFYQLHVSKSGLSSLRSWRTLRSHSQSCVSCLRRADVAVAGTCSVVYCCIEHYLRPKHLLAASSEQVFYGASFSVLRNLWGPRKPQLNLLFLLVIIIFFYS